ncbi:MAG: hypothetical protein WCR19_01240 [Acholeplasmataceae bacterium]
MKTKVIIILFIILLGISILKEPLVDTIDVFSGATNDTYSSLVDTTTGASHSHESDDDDSEVDD